eukprot:6463217-Prymnesium_polylepis.1
MIPAWPARFHFGVRHPQGASPPRWRGFGYHTHQTLPGLRISIKMVLHISKYGLDYCRESQQ